MKKRTRISCKNLGLLTLDSFCEHCFWLEMVLWKGYAPFRFNPPRLINRLDPFQKDMVKNYWVSTDGDWPAWVGPFADAVDCDEGQKITYDDEETGLTIVGIPDLVFEFVDESLGIADCKTASYNDGNDPLLPMYKVQLNAYAFIYEKLGRSVSRLGFTYFEGDTGQFGSVAHEKVTDKGHDFSFVVQTHELNIEPEETVRPLLKRVKRIFDREEPPKATSNCRHCKALHRYADLLFGKTRQVDAFEDAGFIEPRDLGVLDLWDNEENASEPARFSRTWKGGILRPTAIDVKALGKRALL